MRAYRFLNAHFGLKSLQDRRIKISKIDDLNDPFELMPFDLSDRRTRWAFQNTRNQLALTRGILSFSAGWRDPVIWAHYADKHRGVCLGFDIPDELTKRITYRSQRLPRPRNPSSVDAEALLFTKFSNWAYEQEIRVWAPLNDQVDGLYFADFDDKNLRLVVVIAGARCTLPRSALTQALSSLARHTRLVKARGFCVSGCLTPETEIHFIRSRISLVSPPVLLPPFPIMDLPLPTFTAPHRVPASA